MNKNFIRHNLFHFNSDLTLFQPSIFTYYRDFFAQICQLCLCVINDEPEKLVFLTKGTRTDQHNPHIIHQASQASFSNISLYPTYIIKTTVSRQNGSPFSHTRERIYLSALFETFCQNFYTQSRMRSGRQETLDQLTRKYYTDKLL